MSRQLSAAKNSETATRNHTIRESIIFWIAFTEKHNINILSYNNVDMYVEIDRFNFICSKVG